MKREKKLLKARLSIGSQLKQLCFLALGIGLLSVQQTAIAEVPSLDANFLGGTPTAMNNVGQVVGQTDVGGVIRAWVYTPGMGTTYLPAPDGWGAKANAISDTGIIVGSVDDGIQDNAADGATVWNLTTAGYEMSILDMLPATDYGSSANGVNSLGDIIGTRSFLTELTTGRWTRVTRGFVLTNDGTLISNLEDVGFSATPADINDNRQIVGGKLRMNLSTGVIDDLGASTTTNGTILNIIYSYAINESGQVAGMGNNSFGYFPMYYTDGVGWVDFSIPVSLPSSANGINDNGDVVMSVYLACGNSLKPAIYLAAENTTVCLQQMIANQDWQLLANNAAAGISNSRDTAAVAENQVTGQVGAIRLTSNGALPPPLAPGNLVATPHEATPTQPFIAIDLVWTDNSNNESGFRIERTISPQGEVNSWAEIGNVNADVWGFRDNTIEALTTYDYRVVAKGVGGESFSNIETVAAPGPVDTTPPTVVIDSPVDGDIVSGNFTIDITAKDGVNVPVSIVEIEIVLNGVVVNICTVLDPATTSVSCSVNAKKYKLKADTGLHIRVRVYDKMQNMTSASVNVTWNNGTTGGDTGGKGNGRGKK